MFLKTPQHNHAEYESKESSKRPYKQKHTAFLPDLVKYIKKYTKYQATDYDVKKTYCI